MVVLSKMFNLTRSGVCGRTDRTLAAIFRKFKEVRRERFLTADEMRRLGETLTMAEEAKLCSPYAIAAFRLLTDGRAPWRDQGLQVGLCLS